MFPVDAAGAVTSTTPVDAQIPPTNGAGAAFAGRDRRRRRQRRRVLRRWHQHDRRQGRAGRVHRADRPATGRLVELAPPACPARRTMACPAQGQYGALLSGALERSNVDIAEELVGLITAQRNFQANAKAIDTATQISQTDHQPADLMNLSHGPPDLHRLLRHERLDGAPADDRQQHGQRADHRLSRRSDGVRRR